MSENNEKNSSLIGKKWFGLALVLLAIILIVLTIQTNFFEDLSGFDKPVANGSGEIIVEESGEESGEEILLTPAEEDKTVGYTTGYIPASQVLSGENIFSRQRGTKSGD